MDIIYCTISHDIVSLVIVYSTELRDKLFHF